MGVLLVLSCYLIEFAPALMFFRTVIAPDPLRIILFVLGAFFWMLALLASGLVWFLLYPLRDYLVFSILTSVLIQEASRVALFTVLRRAQHGLNQMTTVGAEAGRQGPPAIFHDFKNGRHLLAVISGLGMGVQAALFLTMNIFAALSGPGTIGLPYYFAEKNLSESVIDGDSSPYLMEPDRSLPYYYAFSGMTLSLLHAAWTILVWDSCHKYVRNKPFWWKGVVIAVCSHLFLTSLSFINSAGFQWLYLFVQFWTAFALTIQCHFLMGGNFGSFLANTFFALRDWVLLKWVRQEYRHCRDKMFGHPNNSASATNEENEATEINEAPAASLHSEAPVTFSQLATKHQDENEPRPAPANEDDEDEGIVLVKT